MIKGRVRIDTDRCKGCSLCVSVCPVSILALDTKSINAIGYHPSYVIEPDKCIACAFCATICPDVVIEVERLD